MNNTPRLCSCPACGTTLNRNAKATTTMCTWCKGIHPIGRQILKNKKASDQDAHDAYYTQTRIL